MNDGVFARFGVAQDSPEWLDWKWQYRNRITDVGALSEVLPLGERERRDISSCLSGFRMAVTPYFAALIDPDDPMCPLRMQAVPSADEARVFPWENKDPLREEQYSPTAHIVHRYPDRALFLATRQCAMYCRHCSRKRSVGEEDFVVGEAEKGKAIDYIASTPSIRDVLVSGGDPLTMDDGQLEDIVARLRAISHVEVIRIGTRAPVTMPMRITPALLAMLRQYHPIWMNTQFNHPRELAPLALKACADIVDAGIPLGNQSVLLRNVNDDAATMRELLLGLVKARIRPYYLYQCDLCEGIEHFRTNVGTGIEIIRALKGNISGFAIPEFVIDAPGGGGKIPVSPNYVISMDDEQVAMRNFEGGIYTYPQPK